MKPLRLAFLGLAVASLLPSITSCKSDESPFNWTISSENAKAIIKLRLNVEETRAGEMSTSAEREIKKVTVLVFNEKEQLELNKSVNVTAGTNTVSLEVSNGLKTIYAVAAKSNVNPGFGMSITDYENRTFNSTLANLKTDDGFVMVGKSGEQQVMISASEEDLPSSNIFDIKLERLVAKAQVKSAAVDGSSFGINFGAASFKACQLNERMRVVHNGSDVFDKYEDGNNNGTYDYYSLRDKENYTDAVADFTADGCEYMSENIVSRPLSGNTTYLSIRFATTPAKYYSYNSTTSKVEAIGETPAASTTYYTVGIQDKTNGVVDYALDNSSKHIITFKNQEDAAAYAASLNNGDSSAFTVSQTDSPMKAPSVSEEAANALQFEVITFDSGYAYYRVNIAHQETSGDSEKSTIKVMRNKFYKVNIKSVKSLGFSTEALLRPANPAAELDAEGHSWISASISIAEWDEVNQNVDL
ncbi:MAG: Mfa1 family fimbria major subunit [Muribaculaceae bacterium]|nr:Mfa1 family fimbria major subunit [Muribaculaceae bacterium]